MPRPADYKQSPTSSRRPDGPINPTTIAAFVASLLCVGLMFVLISRAPLVKLPSLVDQGAGIKIFDRFDHPICTVQENENKQPVTLDRMSPYIRESLLVAEDRNFYYHLGIDPAGILRASFVNWRAGRIVEGGSTITQQLVKQLYLDPSDRSFWRKAKEAIMSLDVSLCYSKAKILETYLNEVYFGKGAYGVERAALAYFNKPASKLSMAESAFLAGLIRAPSELSLPANRARAIERQQQILDGMVECGYASRSEADVARKQKLAFREGPHPMQHPYYVSYVISLLGDQLGEKELWMKPLNVFTNMDPNAQKAAEETLRQRVKSAPRGVEQAALASINVPDGAVIAMVGGVGQYEKHQWNRAIYPHTAGSSFKPFVYLSALINGKIRPETMLNDAPITVTTAQGTQYQPKNFDDEFKGWMTARDALALSRNVCAVEVALDTGIPNVVKTARDAGVTATLDPVPSLALGACAVSPLEMATAYSTFARDGVYIGPQFIRKIVSADKSIDKSFTAEKTRKLPSEPVRQLVDIMQDVVAHGTGTAARIPGVPIAGKTGTADQSKDIWFIGFTPDLVTAVWAGNDDNRPVAGHNVTGGAIMAGTWREYMTRYYATHPRTALAFVPPQAPLTRLPMPAPSIASTMGNLMAEVTDGAASAGRGVTDLIDNLVGVAPAARPSYIATAPALPPARMGAIASAPSYAPSRFESRHNQADSERPRKKGKHKSIFGRFVSKLKDIF